MSSEDLRSQVNQYLARIQQLEEEVIRLQAENEELSTLRDHVNPFFNFLLSIRFRFKVDSAIYFFFFDKK